MIVTHTYTKYNIFLFTKGDLFSIRFVFIFVQEQLFIEKFDQSLSMTYVIVEYLFDRKFLIRHKTNFYEKQYILYK